MLQIQTPFPQFVDTDGTPLDSGYVYIGNVGANPETSPLTVFWDEALTQPAAQPIRTQGGYAARAGTPAQLFTDQESYSITVRDKKRRLVYFLADALSSSNIATQVYNVSCSNIAELRTATKTGDFAAYVRGYYVPGDGGGGSFYCDLSDTSSADNGCTIIVAADGGRWKRIHDGTVSLREAGCKGDGSTDDTAGYLVAIGTGLNVYVPKGAYKVAPITTPLSFPPPFVAEGDRTSAAVLATNQRFFGDGMSSRLIWGDSVTKQCFLKVDNANNVVIEGVAFEGGFSALIVDPVSDGSVNNVTVRRCGFKGMLLDVIGGRQPVIDISSKYSKNLSVEFCVSDSPVNHSVLFTNTYNAKAIGNRFYNITNGMCVDMSQGTRGAVIADNVAESVQYFCKVESTDPTGSNPTVFASKNVSITGNVANTISEAAVYLNSATDNITVTGNTFTNIGQYGVSLGQSSVLSHEGNLTVTGNTFEGNGAATAGINDLLTTGDGRHVYASNQISGFNHGMWIARKSAIMTGNEIKSVANGIVVNLTANVNGMTIEGGSIDSTNAGINFSGAGTCKRVTIGAGIVINFGTAGIIHGGTAMEASSITGAILNSAAPTLGGIIIPSPKTCLIQANIINMGGSSLNSIQTSTATTDCLINRNVCTRPLSIAGPAGGTDTTGNITTAAYIS